MVQEVEQEEIDEISEGLSKLHHQLLTMASPCAKCPVGSFTVLVVRNWRHAPCKLSMRVMSSGLLHAIYPCSRGSIVQTP